MIKLKFLTGWNAHLLSSSKLEKTVELGNFQTTLEDLQKIIDRVLTHFDTSDYFYGLFQAMVYSYSSVSPFIATHDYCIKVLHCGTDGTVSMNISPIYHLGLEYPADYKTKHGKDLDEDAIIGLLAKPMDGTLATGHTAYSYGIDAGVLFKDKEIPHNKKITLSLEEFYAGLLITISCENQASSTAIPWMHLGLSDARYLDLSDTRYHSFPEQLSHFGETSEETAA